MKVEHKIGGPIPNLETAKTGKLSSKTGLNRSGRFDAAVAAGDSSKVDVSNRAQLMQKAKEIASHDIVDEAKVARLQKLIDEGKYKTDAAAISDRLVDEHMSFPD